VTGARAAALLCAAVMPVPAALAAQVTAGGARAETFLAAARSGTARYQDRAAAIQDGYRALGPDAPGMGQHWINPSLVLAGRFDAARPQVLTYILVGEQPVLAGVAYAIPTRGGEGAPEEPVGASAWHYHGRTVDEESFLADHHHAGEGAGPDTRVAVLHAWAWVPNPAGAFEPDNWALPFARLGATPPPGAGAAAGKALSLASVGRPFFLKVLRDLCGADSASAALAAGVVAGRAGAIASWVRERGDRPLTPADGAWLEGQWAGLWEDLRRALPDATWAQLSPARGETSGGR